MKDRRVGVLALLALVSAPASAVAQIAGVPVINHPHVPSGPALHALVTFPNDRGGGGYGVTGAFEYGTGRFAFGVIVGARNPGSDLSFPSELAGSVEGYAVYGVTAAVRLLGSPISPFAVAVQLGAGFEDRHRVAGSETVLAAPSRKTFAATLAAGARIEAHGVALEPWAALGPRLVVHDVGTYPPCLRCVRQLGGLGRVVERRGTVVRPGASGGIDVRFPGIVGLRFALDLTETTVPLVLAETAGGIVRLDAESSSLQTTPLLMAAGVTVRLP